jgi:molecular chaperone DnaK
VTDPIVGIDLGTSNSVVAYADDAGAVRVLADKQAFKIHPSVVSFHPNGGVVVGAPAKQRKVIDPKNTIYSVKRLIGRSYDSPEVQIAKQRSPFEIEAGDKGLPVITTRAGKYAVPEVSGIVLDHLRHVASESLETEVKRAVVTVPASFNDAQRSATATAGSIAGMTILRVLNEPTAAALAYGHTRNLRQVVAVYDFGGGTFDITILKLDGQVYEVLGTAGDTFLGGDDIDERLVDRMVAKFLAENRVDLRQNEVAMMRLRAVAEQTKIELSRRTRAVVKIDEIAYGPKGKPLDLQIEITRDELVRQVSDLIDRTFPVCEEALKYAQLASDFVDDVILVGGTTKMPYVRDQVTKFFSKAPRTDVSPEEAVAMGAALQATALDRSLRGKSGGRAATPTETTFTALTTPGGTLDDSATTLPSTDSGPVAATYVMDTPVEAPNIPPSQKARQTAAYNELPKVKSTQEVRMERPVERGRHRDVFEERTPTPVTNAAPIGRLVRPGTAPSGPAAAPPPIPSAPPVPPPVPMRTLQGQAIPEPMPPQKSVHMSRPVMPPPPPMPVAPPPMPAAPPPMPVAPPQAPTLMLDPAPPPVQAFDSQELTNDTTLLSPQSTAPGFPPPPGPSLPPNVAGYPVMPPPVVLDVTPRGLGIGTVAGFCEELIRRNSRVPAEIRKLFTTSRDLQDAVRIIIVQGESRRMNDNVVIGDLRLENLQPRPRGETSIEVTFQLDASGILRVRARDAKTGQEQRASLDLVGAMASDDVAASRERLQTLRR